METAQKIHVLGGSLSLAQAPDGLRSGTDAVFLAAACQIKPDQSVLDLGCGVGTAGLCLAKRVSPVRLTGIDIQADHIDLAQTNAQDNEITADFMCGDIRDLKNERFDHVICNPPYVTSGEGTNSPISAKAIAKGAADLKDWINCALRNLKGRGTLTLIHRADMIDEIFYSFNDRFGSVEIIPLWSKAGSPAKRVVIRAVKDSKSPATIQSGLIVHEADGQYTKQAEAILRNGAALL